MERVFHVSGHFGRFQLTVSAIPVLVSLLSAFHVLAPVYVLYDPPEFRCRLPQESEWHWNDSLTPQSDAHNASILSFIPELVGDDNSSRLDRCHVRANGTVQTCSDWVFDSQEFDSTLVTELGLFCENSRWATFISTCSFAGILVGIVLAGYISDWFGRRISLLITLWLLAVAQVASLFAVSVAFTAAVRFLVGLGALSSSTVVFVMVFELVGPMARPHVASATGYGFSTGNVLVALMAYLTRSWRNYAAVSLILTAALLLLVHFPCLSPETPRWLLSRGRDEAAARIIRRMLTDNGRSGAEADETVKELQGLREKAKEEEGEGEAGGRSMRKSLLLLLRSPRLLLRFGIVCGNWFLVTAIYYGISLGAKNLPGSIFVTACLLGAVDLPSYLVINLTGNRLGRKVTFIGSVAGSGLSLIGLAISSYLAENLTWLIITFSLVGKMLNCIAFSILYIWTGELYPTSIRSTGLSTSSMFARFGTLFAPLLGNIKDFISGDFGPVVSYVIFAAGSFAAAGLAIAVPETRGVPIPDSVQDLLHGNSPVNKNGASSGADLQEIPSKAEEA